MKDRLRMERTGHSIERRIPLAQPFELAHSLEFLRGFWPTAGEQTVRERSLTKLFVAQNVPVAATVTQHGSELRVALQSKNALSEAIADQVTARVETMLSASEDLAPFHRLIQEDPPFAALTRKLHGFH